MHHKWHYCGRLKCPAWFPSSVLYYFCNTPVRLTAVLNYSHFPQQANCKTQMSFLDCEVFITRTHVLVCVCLTLASKNINGNGIFPSLSLLPARVV